MKLHLKTGQTVKVISGKDKGKTGSIIQVFPAMQKVVVDGVNKMYKHVKVNQKTQKGERIEFWGPIHISNVKLTKEAAPVKKEAAAKKEKASDSKK